MKKQEHKAQEVVVLISSIVRMNAKMNRKTHGTKKVALRLVPLMELWGFEHEVVFMTAGWRQMEFTSLEEAKGFQSVNWQG